MYNEGSILILGNISIFFVRHSQLNLEIIMRLGTTTTLARGVTAAASVSTTERLVFIKKVYSLLAMSMLTAAVGAYLGSGHL